MTAKRKPVVLIIRDGWGANHQSDQDRYNAIKLAKKPVDDSLRKEYPITELAAAGLDVGLPEGVMGNSEVGHQNIGAGRVVDQEMVRIGKAFDEGTIRTNEPLQKGFQRVKENGGKLHLMGIVSDAGVHGLLEHLYGLIKEAKEAGVTEVYLHCFTDGRDTSPRSGERYLGEVEAKLKEIGIGQIASVCGRFWAMDRDNRWDRVEKAYRCLVGEKAERTAPDAVSAVKEYYQNPIDSDRHGDEFVMPTWIVGSDGEPVATIGDGDSVIFYNYRGDRPRELTKAFVADDFSGFSRERKLDLYFATMTQYEQGLPVEILFRKPPKMKNILGQVVSERGIPQFRCAETEKYPHVTFFFNDYREEPFDGEDRKMAPSPKVSTYDQQPEMSAAQVRDYTKEAILSGKYGLIVVNFANPDMVGHTGSLEATVKAVEFVDQCVGELLEALSSVEGSALVTADHGNADQMFDPASDGPHTSHTLNKVECVFVTPRKNEIKAASEGRLADIAPTILSLMEEEIPAEMTGRVLIS
ncbi:MAG: 2,3-bisphosphoglycerate-independent phosphoglycerate mutase [Opitutales bacterium]|nr:2,3-bisphosphoglycerate-independent phosphoglycerate mutase [Opitutales bacterium]